jgi:hypothetical protein
LGATGATYDDFGTEKTQEDLPEEEEPQSTAEPPTTIEESKETPLE